MLGVRGQEGQGCVPEGSTPALSTAGPRHGDRTRATWLILTRQERSSHTPATTLSRRCSRLPVVPDSGATAAPQDRAEQDLPDGLGRETL